MQTQTAEPILQLQLPVTEVNFILGLVGKQPYDQVAGLIDKIRAQAAPQLVAFAQQQEQAAPAAPADGQQTSGNGEQF